MSLLEPSFYAQPVLDLAAGLLGCELHLSAKGENLRARIVEVEAYHQHGDPASHSRNGPSARNAAMFRDGGCLYVYFIYGMHYCVNVVAEEEGVGAAVLLRAVEPLAGIESMRRRRGAGTADIDLANGPAKLCQAFGIGRAENGLPLDGEAAGIYRGSLRAEEHIGTSARVGIRRGTRLPWRFFLQGNPFVSKGTPPAFR